MTTFYLDHSWLQQAKSDRYYYNFLPARPWGLGQYLTEKERVLQARFFQTIQLIFRCCSKSCFLDYHKNQNNMRPFCCPIQFHTAFTVSSWRYFKSLLSFSQIFLFLSQILLLLLTAIFHQTHTSKFLLLFQPPSSIKEIVLAGVRKVCFVFLWLSTLSHRIWGLF